MQCITIRFVSVAGFLLLILLFGVTATSRGEPTYTPTIFARVTNASGTYLVSFSADAPGANTLFAAQHPPSNFLRDSLYLTQDGKWIVWVLGIEMQATSSTFDHIYYSKLGDALPTQPIDGWWPSVSADSQYLFYADIDSSGTYETFNLLSLATGAHIELIVAPLDKPVKDKQELQRLPKYLVPMDNWTLENKHLLFTNFGAYPNSVKDISGFARVDLSNIDLNTSGTYNLPPITPISSIARRATEGVLSPDGQSFAYVFLPDTKQGSAIFLDAYNGIAIFNLRTGNYSTFMAKNDEAITSLTWNNDSLRLTYYSSLWEQSDNARRINQYDLVSKAKRKQSQHLQADDVLRCGDWSFETQTNPGQRSQTVYSSRGIQPNKTALFSADRIMLLSCAPTMKWNPAKVGNCDPFCTPTPIVIAGKDADVTKLNLSGGDAANGKQLYSELGCSGCHLLGGIGVETKGMYTRILTVALKDPVNAALTGEQFVAQSIIQPNAYAEKNSVRVLMPIIYGDYLSLSELRDLVAFVKAQK